MLTVEVDTIEPDDEGTNNIGEMLGSKGAEYDASNVVMSQPGLLAGKVSTETFKTLILLVKSFKPLYFSEKPLKTFISDKTPLF